MNVEVSDGGGRTFPTITCGKRCVSECKLCVWEACQHTKLQSCQSTPIWVCHVVSAALAFSPSSFCPVLFFSLLFPEHTCPWTPLGPQTAFISSNFFDWRVKTGSALLDHCLHLVKTKEENIGSDS